MLLSYCAGLLLAGWFLASVVNQFAARTLRDPLGLIPRWTFFAPNPGEFDYHLVYCDYDSDEAPVTSWIEIDRHAERTLLSAVWNPGKRYRKAVIDCCQMCLRYRNEPAKIQMALPYLALLNIVLAERRAHDAALRRFAVVGTKRFGGFTPKILIHSELHALC